MIFDQLASMLNIDPSLIAETFTRQITGLVTSGSDILNCVDYFSAAGDMYQTGICVSQLVKLLFDINISNT